MKHLQLIFQVSLAAFMSVALLSASLTCTVAQAQEEQLKGEIAPLDEDFLLFLAEGMEVEGEWKDPMTLASLSDLDEIPSEEIAWVAEQDKTTLTSMTEEVVDGGSKDGEENE